jgi:hypothetical protein
VTVTTRTINMKETRVRAADLDVLIVEAEGKMPIIAVAAKGFELKGSPQVLSVRAEQLDELIEALNIAKQITN